MSVRIVSVFIVFCGFQLTSEAAPQDIANGTTSDHDPCAGLTYCTKKPPDYPQDRYDEMFKGKITEPIFRPRPVINDEPIDRMNPELRDNCDSIAHLEQYYLVRNSPTEKWRTVIQSDKRNFLQLVRIELCTKPYGPCFIPFKVPSPKDYDVHCLQGYNRWKFLVDDEKGGVEEYRAMLPICCFCTYKIIPPPREEP